MKAWVAELVATGTGAGTTKNIANAMKAVMSAAVEGGAVRVKPCVGVKLPRPDRDEMRFLTAEQVFDLADAIGADYRTLVLFAAYTGMRAGEIVALRWERIDLLRGTVDVVESYAEVHGKLVLGPTKTYARRTVKLPRSVCDLLGEHQAVTGPTGLVFMAERGGPLRHGNFYRRRFKPATFAAWLERLRFHDLRHTCVALLVAQGAHPMGDQGTPRAQLDHGDARSVRAPVPRDRRSTRGRTRRDVPACARGPLADQARTKRRSRTRRDRCAWPLTCTFGGRAAGT